MKAMDEETGLALIVLLSIALGYVVGLHPPVHQNHACVQDTVTAQ